MLPLLAAVAAKAFNAPLNILRRIHGGLRPRAKRKASSGSQFLRQAFMSSQRKAEAPFEARTVAPQQPCSSNKYGMHRSHHLMRLIQSRTEL